MPTLVIDNVPVSRYARIENRAKVEKRTPADTVLEMLESAFRITYPEFSEPPLPQASFLTEEICAPFEIPWPKGERVFPIHVAESLPDPHDIPDSE